MHRLSVPGSIARLMTVAAYVTHDLYLPWMAPYADQARLASKNGDHIRPIEFAVKTEKVCLFSSIIIIIMS